MESKTEPPDIRAGTAWAQNGDPCFLSQEASENSSSGEMGNASGASSSSESLDLASSAGSSGSVDSAEREAQGIYIGMTKHGFENAMQVTGAVACKR